MNRIDREFEHPFYHDNVFLTFDTDWASEKAIKFVINILENEGLKGTFFATHLSESLKNLDNKYFETGIHPNFRGKTFYESIINELKCLYPDAIGVRSHGLFSGSDINQAFFRSKLCYDSNIFLSYMNYVKPYEHCTGIYKIPFIWADDYHIDSGNNCDQMGINFNKLGLKVLAFHPVHIYYNTCSKAYYEEIKKRNYPDIQDVDLPSSGIRLLFYKMIKDFKKLRIETNILRHIYDDRKELD